MAREVQPKEPLTHVMQPRKRPSAPASNDPLFNWIEADEPHGPLCATVQRIVTTQNGRLWNNTRLLSLYANQDLTATAGATRIGRPQMPRQSINLAKIYGDTLAGKLVQSNSKVTFLSSGGDWKVFRTARKADRALEAEFRRGRLYQHASKVALDGINVGTAYLHVYEGEKGTVEYERWYPNEVFVDELDAAYGEPSMMFRKRYIKRENALAMWPDKADIIMRASLASAPSFAWTVYQHGMIEIVEGWALPMGERKGRHVLAVRSGCLVDEEWKSSRFPVAVFKAGDLPLGWYGQGLLEHAAGTQMQMNKILNIMAKAAELGIAPYWVLAGGAEISFEQLSNVPGHIVQSSGQAPAWVTNPPFHSSAVNYLEYMRKDISSIYAINEIESGAGKGYNRVDSDPALSTMQDMWMARHMIMLKNWSEFFFLDVAERTMDVAMNIARKKGTYPVQATARGKTELMDWRDFLQLRDDSYTLQMATMSFLPTTPAAKYARIVEMKNEALITPGQAKQALAGPPDLDYITAEVSAVDNDADRVIEELMAGEISTPHGFQVMEEIVPRVRAAALVALDRDAPAKVIKAFDDWLAMAVKQIQDDNLPLTPTPGGTAANSFGPEGSGLGGGVAGALGGGAAIAPPGGAPALPPATQPIA